MVGNLIPESGALLITNSKVLNWLRWDEGHKRGLPFVPQLPLTPREEDYQVDLVGRNRMLVHQYGGSVKRNIYLSCRHPFPTQKERKMQLCYKSIYGKQ